MNLHDLVRTYREEHNISQRQFATCCGLSNGYISMLEKNVNPKTGQPITPSLEVLRKISAGMGITLTELLSKVSDMPVDLSTDTDTADIAPAERTMLGLFRELNDEGQERAINYTDDLVSSGKYIKTPAAGLLQEA